MAAILCTNTAESWNLVQKRILSSYITYMNFKVTADLIWLQLHAMRLLPVYAKKERWRLTRYI